MSPVPSETTQIVLAAIERARNAYPAALLQLPQRLALRTELAATGLDLDSADPALGVVHTMLTEAAALEDEGEFAFIPLWTDLIRAISGHLPGQVA